MKRLTLDLLATTDAVENPLFHESGQVLFKRGEPLKSEHLQALRQMEIATVYELEAGDNIGDFIHNARFEGIAPKDLLTIHRIAQPVYAADGKLLVQKGQQASPTLKQTLVTLKIPQVFVEREGLRLDIVELFVQKKQQIERDAKRRQLAKLALSKAKLVLSGEVKDAGEVASMAATGSNMDEKPDGAGLDRLVDFTQKVRNKDVLAGYQAKFDEACRRTKGFWDSLLTGEMTEGEKAMEVAREIILMMIDDKDLFLNILNMESAHHRQIVHAVKTAYMTANIATSMTYNENQVLEMCIGALLADIGMFTVPELIREKPAALSDGETQKMREHVAAGLKLLRKLTAFPQTTMFAVYQHHERLDGSGYPKGFQGANIHIFAKIVSIADSYIAMISERKHRGKHLPYVALETIIREASNRRYGSDIVRALLKFTSLFPVGSWVELSTGSIGKVVASHPQNYARPTVQPLFDAKTKRPLESMMAVELAKQPRVRVIQAVDGTKFDGDLMRGF